jgi:ribosome biogenesis SPOUT family RNA methylase Rps3
MIRPEVLEFRLRSLRQLTLLDRTSELRKKGFTGRRLGPVQMTTDTAVRVTRKVVLEHRRTVRCSG